MFVVGGDQGPIEGDVVISGRENSFEVNELHHLTTAGSNGADNEALILTTPMSRGVPSLLLALDSQESLQIRIEFYRSAGAEGAENFYTLELEDARLKVAEPIKPDLLNSDSPDSPVRVRFRFSFSTLTHTYEPDEESVEL